MSRQMMVKDPDADLDYLIDWTRWLGADTIAESTWSVPPNSGLVAHDPMVDDTRKKAVVWLSGGVLNATPWQVTNHITTESGRVDDRSLLIVVKQK